MNISKEEEIDINICQCYKQGKKKTSEVERFATPAKQLLLFTNGTNINDPSKEQQNLLVSA